MKVDYVKLGKRVRYYREKAGLSQIQLAELVDIVRVSRKCLKVAN